MAVNSLDIRALANLIYVGKVRDSLTLSEFKQICNAIDDLSEFVDSPFFPYLAFDDSKGFEVIPDKNGDGKNIFLL